MEVEREAWGKEDLELQMDQECLVPPEKELGQEPSRHQNHNQRLFAKEEGQELECNRQPEDC